MRSKPTCPRCGGEVRAPGLWSSSWQCERHGNVLPFHVLPRPGPEAVEHVASRARVPLWAPWPLPPGWVANGVGFAGDDRSGAGATVFACCGPSPLGGGADLLLVAEEPGIGLGARYARLPGPDPGGDVGHGAPHAKVEAAGHPTALWHVPGPDDSAVFAGEAKALWLWAVVWPATAGVLLYDNLVLTDLREAHAEAELAYGTLSPRLAG